IIPHTNFLCRYTTISIQSGRDSTRRARALDAVWHKAGCARNTAPDDCLDTPGEQRVPWCIPPPKVKTAGCRAGGVQAPRILGRDDLVFNTFLPESSSVPRFRVTVIPSGNSAASAGAQQLIDRQQVHHFDPVQVAALAGNPLA